MNQEISNGTEEEATAQIEIDFTPSGNSLRGREVQAKAHPAHKEASGRVRQQEGRGLVYGNRRDLAQCLTGLAGTGERL